jgi:hypothetical protein
MLILLGIARSGAPGLFLTVSLEQEKGDGEHQFVIAPLFCN